MKNLYFATAALLLCSATAFATTLTITTPSNGDTVSTAMRVTASTDNGTAIYAYVDDNLVYTVQGQQLDTALNVSVGQHHLVLVTWDSVGNPYTAECYVTAQDTAPPSSGIAISTPADGATIPSPVHFALTAANAQTIYIYVDDQLLYRVNAAQVDTSLAMSAGSHHVVVQSWDAAGTLSRVSEYITVSGSTNSPSSNGITVSSPANGATVGSPVQFNATAANAVAMHIYVDNQLAYQVNASSINTSLAMGSGAHYVVVQAWDQFGSVTKSPLNITVSGLHQIELTWTPPQGVDVAYYNVYRGDLPGGPYTLIGKTSGVSYVDSSMPLMTLTSYYYVVATVDQNQNESAYSVEAAAWLP